MMAVPMVGESATGLKRKGVRDWGSGCIPPFTENVKGRAPPDLQGYRLVRRGLEREGVR
jgi:hypothetical protein